MRTLRNRYGEYYETLKLLYYLFLKKKKREVKSNEVTATTKTNIYDMAVQFEPVVCLAGYLQTRIQN